MASRGRGGYRQPRKPAAASGPGTLARRTDGGPANPIVNAPAATYGDRQQREQMAQAAPLRAGGPDAPPPSPDQMSGPPVPAPVDPWAPTDRPLEPITSGAELGPGAGPEDPLDDVRASAAALLLAVADVDPTAARTLRELIEEIDER